MHCTLWFNRKNVLKNFTKSCGEVIEDDFGPMASYFSPISFDVFCDFDIAQFKMCSGTLGKMCNNQSVWHSVILVYHHNICVSVSDSLLNRFLDGRILAPKWCRVGNNSGQFLHESDGSLFKLESNIIEKII